MFSSNPTSDSANDMISSIEVMRQQEEATYHSVDYLYQQQVEQATVTGPLPTGSPIDVDCRTKMCEWNYQIVDFCKFSRETASIAMNYLDRYLMTESGRRALMSKKIYQLAAMTCLYTAVKLHEPEAMDPALVANLSRGMYTESQITDMEVVILNALKWRVNPPTMMSFIRHFFSLLPSSMMSPQIEVALEIARFQSELAVINYDFVSVNASTIAFACVANALERVNCDAGNFLEAIANISSIENDSMEMCSVRDALRSTGALKKCGNLLPSPSSPVKEVESACGSVHVSPRSVANRA